MSYLYDSSDDRSEDDGSARGDSSDGDFESVDPSEDGHPQPGEQTFAPEGSPFDTFDGGNLSIVSLGSKRPYDPVSIGLLSWLPTPSSSARRIGGSDACSSSSRFSFLPSSATDPILKPFIQRACSPRYTALSVQQSTRLSIVSSDQSTRSTQTDPCNAPSIFDRVGGTLETSATSESNQEEDILFAIHQDVDDQELAIPSDAILIGLEPQDYSRLNLFLQNTNLYNSNNFDDLLNLLPTEHPQADPHATPWVPGIQAIKPTTIGESTLAPPPGLVYTEYYSSGRTYTQGNRKKVQNRNNAIQGNPKAVAGTSKPHKPHKDISPYFLAQYSTFADQLQSGQLRDLYASDEGHTQEILQQPLICPVVDCVSISPESLGSIFYPTFAFRHLSAFSLETFTTKIIAPNSIPYKSEHSIDLFLGFGPPLKLEVYTFTPNNEEDLQSFQKPKGEENLRVQRSLPLFLYLFAVEEYAGKIDDWLGQTIKSKIRLQEYVDLMDRRQNGDLSVRILRFLVTSQSAIKDEFSRTALKLLITVTLLSLVQRVENIPESLSLHFSPQPIASNKPPLSNNGPKLLTRQIKASIHHLQHSLLHSLSSYFTCTLKLATEVEVAVALLTAFTLDLTQNAVRDFARHANTINSAVSVKSQDVTKYEIDMQTQVFDKVRARVLGVKGNMGQLGGISGVIGKGKEIQGCQFVPLILDSIL